jgi:2-C-methyl-D-erythritol 2,4-cyclodiphosphate synthase
VREFARRKPDSGIGRAEASHFGSWQGFQHGNARSEGGARFLLSPQIAVQATPLSATNCGSKAAPVSSIIWPGPTLNLIGDSATDGLRIGIGHDTHRLAPGGTLRLGGVEIPHDAHLIGHSDADVLLHAITDALLGATALGDIGELFPDTEPANRGRDSAQMLRAAAEKVTAAGYRIANLDCIVFAQRPKLSPYKSAIQKSIADLLELDANQVGLKAKTGESVGPVGREEAIQAECIVLLCTSGFPA